MLIGTAIAVSLDAGRVGVLNPGPHGFSEILYALSSASNNNGSALRWSECQHALLQLVVVGCHVDRTLWRDRTHPGHRRFNRCQEHSSGELGHFCPTHTPLFITLLVATIVLVAALSFFPALALGPIVEQLLLTASST